MIKIKSKIHPSQNCYGGQVKIKKRSRPRGFRGKKHEDASPVDSRCICVDGGTAN